MPSHKFAVLTHFVVYLQTRRVSQLGTWLQANCYQDMIYSQLLSRTQLHLYTEGWGVRLRSCSPITLVAFGIA